MVTEVGKNREVTDYAKYCGIILLPVTQYMIIAHSKMVVVGRVSEHSFIFLNLFINNRRLKAIQTCQKVVLIIVIYADY